MKRPQMTSLGAFGRLMLLFVAVLGGLIVVSMLHMAIGIPIMHTTFKAGGARPPRLPA